MRVRLSVSGVIEYLTVIFMLLDFSTPYSCALNINYSLTRTTGILAVVLLLIYIYPYGIKMHTLNRWLLYFIPFYLLQIIFLSHSVDSAHAYTFVTKFMFFFPAFVFLFMLYTERGEMYRFLEKYVNVVTFIAGISLFFWLFGSQMGIIQPTNYIYASWGGNYNYPIWFGVYTQRQEENFLGIILVRNQGIFCEAPMYNFILIVALAYELFLRNHVEDKNGVSRLNILRNDRNVSKDGGNHFYSKADGAFSVASNSSIIIKQQMQRKRVVTFRLILLIVTILTTLTTTGMILLIMAFVLRYMFTKSRDYILRSIKPLLIVLVCIAGLYMAIQIFLQKSSSFSWKIHFDDLRAGFLAFLSSPLTGTGFESYTVIDMFRSSWRTAGGRKAGFSNSIMRILGQGGLVLGLVYFIPIIGTIWKSVRSKQYDIFAFTALITVAFSLTIVCYSLVMLTIIAFFNAYIIESKTRTQSVSLLQIRAEKNE